jgi:ABC-type transport system substrate-binding protein
LAQFRAGNIHIAEENTVRLDDVLDTKNAVPELLMFQSGDFGDSGVHEFFGFGYEGQSPWDDIRMRQAAALLIDREAYTDLVTGRDIFEKAGISVPNRWVTWVPTDREGFWLDPKNEKEFGPAAKYFRFDPKEAKALMSAAGFPNGLSTTYTFQTARDPSYDKFAAIVPQMLNDGGIKVQTVGVDNTTYVRDILRAYAAGNTKGPPDGKGITQRTMPVIASVYLGMEAAGHPGGRNFIGFTPDGNNAHMGDPEITALFPRMKAEFDLKKQQAIAWDFQRQMAQKAYAPNLLVDSPLFEMAWPCVGNFRAFDGKRQQGGQNITEGGLQLWIDDSKPPFKKA